MASSSKQYDTYQVLATLLASDDESIDSCGNDSISEKSTDESEYDEPCIRDVDVHAVSRVQFFNFSVSRGMC